MDDKLNRSTGYVQGSVGDYRKDDSERGVGEYRGRRNDLPERVNYVYRGRTYAWAQQQIAAAEAKYGKPPDHPEITRKGIATECVSCGCHIDEYTDGCKSCNHRRAMRAVHARRRESMLEGWCGQCGYRKTAVGHKIRCEGEAA